MLLRYGCGITAAVGRSTRSAGEVGRAEFRRSADAFERKVAHYRPHTIAFLGKGAYAAMTGLRDPGWGAQAGTFGSAPSVAAAEPLRPQPRLHVGPSCRALRRLARRVHGASGTLRVERGSVTAAAPKRLGHRNDNDRTLVATSLCPHSPAIGPRWEAAWKEMDMMDKRTLGLAKFEEPDRRAEDPRAARRHRPRNVHARPRDRVRRPLPANEPRSQDSTDGLAGRACGREPARPSAHPLDIACKLRFAKEELSEVVQQMAPFTGFPGADAGHPGPEGSVRRKA
jgi:hypothetical protein